MDVFDSVRTVLAVRKFQDKAVPHDVVHQIVEAGRLSASGKNEQPWHFIVVDDRSLLQKIASMAPTGRYIAQAPLAVVVAIENTPYAVSDGSRAIQDMILTAWGSGIGSNWTGFKSQNGVRPLLGIPETLEILAIIPFGYPAEKIGKGKKNRKPLSQVVSLNRYGSAFK